MNFYNNSPSEVVVLEDSPDFPLSQCAQDPLFGFSEEFPEFSRARQNLNNEQKEKRTKRKRESHHSMKPTLNHSFVQTKDRRKGYRVIQIKVLDLDGDQDQAEESVVISAQYVVRDCIDEIMDQTESIINKISKKLCSDNL